MVWMIGLSCGRRANNCGEPSDWHGWYLSEGWLEFTDADSSLQNAGAVNFALNAAITHERSNGTTRRQAITKVMPTPATQVLHPKWSNSWPRTRLPTRPPAK